MATAATHIKPESRDRAGRERRSALSEATGGQGIEKKSESEEEEEVRDRPTYTGRVQE